MKAALRDRYGPPEVVELLDVDRPSPVDDQVLVRVEAASVNRADLDNLHARWAFMRLFLGLRRPRERRIGLDVAGVVEAVGPAATRFRPGDRVFADLYSFGTGAFAEFACAPERAFAAIPDGMTFEVAATLPHSAVLALQGLRWRDGRTIGPGDRVLIDGAGGNVGPFAIQIARSRGAVVTAVDHTEKLDLMRSLGADQVIDYTQVDYTTTGVRYDWILDVDSHHPILRCRRALRPNGVYITLGGTLSRILAAVALGPVISRATGRRMGLLTWWKPFKAEDVTTLASMIEAGTLTPAIDRRYPLSEIVEALRHVDEGRARGKVVIT
jgi:NADPH:quinone reductase-like Zn-dependent oxidoreductase